MLDAHRRGSLFAVTGMYLWRGFTLFWRGDLIDAEEELAVAFDRPRAGATAGHAAVERRAPSWWCLTERGDLARRARGAALVPRPSAAGAPTARATGATRAWSCWSPRAATRTRRGRRRVRARRFARYHNPPAARWSSLQARRARRARDEAQGDRAGRRGARPRARLGRARHGRALAARARLLEGAEGLERLEEAVELVLEGAPARLELAKSLAARLARRRGGPTTRASRCPARTSWPRCAAPSAGRRRIRTEMLAVGVEPR